MVLTVMVLNWEVVVDPHSTSADKTSPIFSSLGFSSTQFAKLNSYGGNPVHELYNKHSAYKGWLCDF